MRIGPYQFTNQLAAAPMAGVTDRPFRQLCRALGAGFAVSEMVAANPRLRATRKSRLRTDHAGETGPTVVQIAGGDAQMMAQAARYNVDLGADIIDINMGCPAKKVYKKAAGSALLANEALVAAILDATVSAVEVPVTLKIRTGVDAANRNGVRIARLAENCGIAAISVHGRTRDQHFKGRAEYDTVRQIKQAVSIPVIANGDIDSAQSARRVLDSTGADGLMIGRAACRRPWLFREIEHYLRTGKLLAPPTLDEERDTILTHLAELYDFYGERDGVRIARKHLNWQFERHVPCPALRFDIMAADSSARQHRLAQSFYRTLATHKTGGIVMSHAA